MESRGCFGCRPRNVRYRRRRAWTTLGRASRGGGPIVASARLCLHTSVKRAPGSKVYTTEPSEKSPPFAFFNRLVVHPEFQRRGLSKLLYPPRIDAAAQAGCRFAFTYASIKRTGALATFGFESLGQADFAKFGEWPEELKDRQIFLKALSQSGDGLAELDWDPMASTADILTALPDWKQRI